MVLITNYKDKNKSIYKCDKCKKEISIKEINKVVIDRHTKHLCNECYVKLAKWIYNTKRR